MMQRPFNTHRTKAEDLKELKALLDKSLGKFKLGPQEKSKQDSAFQAAMKEKMGEDSQFQAVMKDVAKLQVFGLVAVGTGAASGTSHTGLVHVFLSNKEDRL